MMSISGSGRRLTTFALTLILGMGLLTLSTACRAAAPPGDQAGGAKAAGALTILGGDPPTLDPAVTSDSTSATYIVEIYSGLVTLNQKLEVVPDIAKSWEVSPDGTTYTFRLRDDVKFHDGKKVTAQDFKYSLERAADPKTESVVADTYLGDILGVKERLAGKANEIKGIQVVDDHTLRIQIDKPKAYFLAKLTYPTAFVLDKANVESSKNWTNKPNGTGPFKLTEWRKGERIVLERNPNFYLGPAKLEQVRFLLAGGSAMTMYENNEIDITGVGINDIDRVLDKTNPLNKDLTIASSLSVSYIGLDSQTPPFDDVKVRQALNHAVDRDKIIKVVLKGLVEKAKGPLPPGLPGYNPDLKGLEFDPERAKRLVQESKYEGKLPPITLTVPGSAAGTSPTIDAIIEMLKQNLGAEVKVQQVEFATFLEDLKKHRFQMFSIGWIADYPDPQDFLDILFHSQSLDNNPRYSNPQVDKLLEDARVEQNVEKRLKLYQQAEQLIVNDAPWLPLWYGKAYLLMKPFVKGYVEAPMVIPTYRFVSVEKK